MIKIKRLTIATIGILLCLKLTSQSPDLATFLICALFLPIFFIYGILAINQNEEDK
jgi:hypothetical protein